MGYVQVAAFVIPNMQWSVDGGSRLDEVTQSDSGGPTTPCTLYGFVRQDNSWEIHVKRDDVAYPEAAGLTQGAILDAIYFKLGAGSKCDKLVNTTVENVKTVNDPVTKFVEVVVTGKGGLRVPNQDLPS